MVALEELQRSERERTRCSAMVRRHFGLRGKTPALLSFHLSKTRAIFPATIVAGHYAQIASSLPPLSALWSHLTRFHGCCQVLCSANSYISGQSGLKPISRSPYVARARLSEKMSKMRALWQASVNATKKALTWNVEEWVPPTERYIFNFNSKQELKQWHLYSDSQYGGLSEASLEVTETGDGAHGIFSGKLSLDLSEGSKWNMTRSGFCGMRSKKFDGFIDLDAYDSIALKLKGDGRCYISTIYTENWVNSPGQEEDNSWQSFVLVPKDNWYIAKLPLARYLPTWRGNVIDANLEMNRSRIVGMSLSLNARGGVPGARTGPGDFKVEVDWIKALRTQ